MDHLSNAIADAMTELLIENMTMRELLKERQDLNSILTRVKSDSTKREKAEFLVAPLRTAILDEIEVEKLFQKIRNPSGSA